MNEDNELQDILLDKSADQKSGKFRKILITIAALAVLFIAVLALMKFLSSDPIPPAASTPELITPPAPPSAPDSFEQVPIANEPVMPPAATMPPPPPPPPASDMQAPPSQTINLAPEPFTKPAAPEAPKPEPIKPAPIKPEPVKSAPIKPAIPDMPQPSKPTPSKPAPAKPAKPAKQESAVVPAEGQSVPTGLYIQVASPTKISAKDPFLAKVKAAGYNYHIYEATVNGRKVAKVLIGPFADKKALEQDMPIVREKIAKGAFIFRVK